MFPAIEGDCFLVTIQTEAGNERILIDGGRSSTGRAIKEFFEKLPEGERYIDLFIVTHIDADHIAGALKLLDGNPLFPRISEIWFNAYQHLDPARQVIAYESFGPAQGDKLSDAISRHEIPWNKAFGGGAVVIPSTAPYRRVRIGAETNITVLSPDADRLKKLDAEWSKHLRSEGLERGTPTPDEPPPGLKRMGGVTLVDIHSAASQDTYDRAIPNGSSIAFLLEAKDRRILFTGDAHPDLLEEGVGALAEQEGGKLKIDLLKISHHGSRDNTTNKLLSLIDCENFAISTNGSRHDHPHQESIAKIIRSREGRKNIYFNYQQPHTYIWANNSLKETHNYETFFPKINGHLSVRIDQNGTCSVIEAD